MLREFLRFEFYYRGKRISTYSYAIIIFLITFLIIVSPKLNVNGAEGQVMANAPYVITYLILVLTFAFTMVTSAISGVTIVRDFDHNMESILYSTRLTKFGYLMGRFLGSFIILIALNAMIILGLVVGFAVGRILPWDVSWEFRDMLPMQLESYIFPFLIFTIPNIFISASLFFMSGALGRNAIVIYTQGVILIVLYQIAFSLLKDLDSQYLAALIDPFGVQTFLYLSKYWTSAEKNSLNVPMDSVLVFNRLIWVSLGVASLLFTYFKFSFSVAKGKGKIRRETMVPDAPPVFRKTVSIKTDRGLVVQVVQLLRQSWMYFKMTVKEVPFLAIIICGLITLIIKAFKIDQIYGTSSYPTTFAMLGLLSSFDLFFLIVVIFYSGELIWKDHNVNFHLIQDALPVPSIANLVSKFLTLLLIYILLLFALIVCGVLIQSAFGYYKFELSIYFGTLYTSTLSFLVLYTLFSFFVQALVNNKFQGFVICIVFYILNALLNQFGVEHDLLRFASGSLGVYSDMNKYGHFVTPFSWLKIYWFSFTVILFLVGALFYTRGSDTGFRQRWKVGRGRARPLFALLILFPVFFISSGFYIYYNTLIVNQFHNSNERQQAQADYELKLKKYEKLVQPKITAVKIKAELYPYSRNFIADGLYILKNKSDQAINEIHIQNQWNDRVTIDNLSFDRAATIEQEYKNYRYTIYRLGFPLQPSDSIHMQFKVSYITDGFKEIEDTDLVFNGTFISNEIFPSIGYNPSHELVMKSDRDHFQLPTRNHLPDPQDSAARLVSIFGDDADQIRFEVEIGTAPDQIALAPGTLQKDWMENGRRYFRYSLDSPMNNFYSILSARYAVKTDEWNGVQLQILYHQAHPYNLDRMMQAMKDALAYYSANFGPYPYPLLRIVEFPRYAAFAQSYSNTIPYSEGFGFILKIKNPKEDLDVPYYVTAHEVAHQWWGNQLTQARAKGASIISEGLSQYAALMIMKKNLHPEQVERYLKYEQDSYLKGRSSERRKERPLMFCEDQPYIFYNKASLVFFALQDYVGEENLNKALSRFYDKWNRKQEYPTVLDLMREIRMVTPDSLQYLIHDMFETITLFENETESASYEQRSDGTYALTLKMKTRKIQADSSGRESIVPVDDWIDVGVYDLDSASNLRLIYLQKYKFTSQDKWITINLKNRPARAGVDPLHKLIDRHLIDNVVDAKEIIPFSLGQ